jgi:RNA-directed DNA polymerase
MEPTELHITTDTKLTRIAWLSKRDPQKVFQTLMHHFNEDSLKDCFNALDGRKAVGIDGIDKAEYGEKLDENIEDLVARMKRMAYRPLPVRQVLIPKEGKPGAKRPLGISVIEDKIVQKMVQKVLESIYEPLFLDCSYGFRPGRGCHTAVKDLWEYLDKHTVSTVIDVDLANYFGSIDHKELVKILREKVKDERFIRYLIRMFKAGVLAEGELMMSDEGVPQGSLCSPVLSNIFAHVVIDVWFEDIVKRHCKGRAAIFRYCDDLVICCQYKEDAARIKTALGKRLARYKLTMNEDKTKLVTFSKAAYRQGEKQGTFDFLGFTFYWGRTRKGAAVPMVKTSRKRMRTKLKRVKEWVGTNKDRYSLKQLWKPFCQKLEGHVRYYGVSFNKRGVGRFLYHAERIIFQGLNRRSQRRSFNWERFEAFVKAHPRPRNRVYHPLF